MSFKESGFLEQAASVPVEIIRKIPSPVEFKIEAGGIRVRLGDRVSPETAIGTSYETGEAVFAGCDGRVSSLAFSGGEHTFMVSVVPSSP